MRSGTVYRAFSANGELLYVGTSIKPEGRFQNHAQTKNWWAEVDRIDIEHCVDQATALKAEKEAIASESPRYNTVGRRRVKVLRATAPSDPNQVQITIRITKTQHAVLQAVARHEGRTVSAEVRRLVESFEREHAAHEHVAERGHGYTACMACGEMPDHPIHRVDLWPVGELTEHKERA